MSLSETDLTHLRRCVELAREGLFVHDAPVEGGSIPVECRRMVRDVTGLTER